MKKGFLGLPRLFTPVKDRVSAESSALKPGTYPKTKRIVEDTMKDMSRVLEDTYNRSIAQLGLDVEPISIEPVYYEIIDVDKMVDINSQTNIAMVKDTLAISSLSAGLVEMVDEWEPCFRTSVAFTYVWGKLIDILTPLPPYGYERITGDLIARNLYRFGYVSERDLSMRKTIERLAEEYGGLTRTGVYYRNVDSCSKFTTAMYMDCYHDMELSRCYSRVMGRFVASALEEW